MNDELISKTVCFTGHREVIHKYIDSALDKTVTELAEKGYLYFGAGGAKGFDYLAAKSVLRVQQSFPDIKLIIVLPNRDYYDRWDKFDKDAYMELLNHAHKVRILSETYYKGCMHARNKHLVDNSSVCVCYKYKESGGTAHTVKYAEKKGIPVINVI